MYDRNTILPLIGDKSSKISDANIRIADKALNNIIEPFPGYPDIEFSKDFDWSHQQPTLEKTYQLYLQCLRVPGVLLAQFEKTNKIEYFNKAEEIINSWVEFIHSGQSTEMTWYDHTSGSRSRVLIQYLAIASELDRSVDTKSIISLLEDHAKVLMDDSFHKMNNHGIMVDMALVSMGLGIDRMDYVYKGISRLENIFWQTYSEAGMHQENSPAYHGMVYRMYREIEKYLEKNNLSFGHGYKEKMELISKHFSKIARPSGALPSIGDTSGGNNHNISISWENFHDQMSGFTVFKDRSLGFYLSFICGYSTVVHKHADDLSITLDFDSKEFFIDSGMYNYGKNKYRNFVISNKAHSSFSLTRQYAKDRNNRYTKLIATDKFLEAPNYNLVSGYNKGYENAELRRTIYTLCDENLILINDVSKSSKEQEIWVQRFVLSPQATAEIINPRTVKVSNDGADIFLQWVSDVPEINIVSGDINTPLEAVVSEKSHQITPTLHLVCEYKETKSIDSIIAISLSEKFSGEILQESDRFSINFHSEENKDYILPRFKDV